VNVSPYFSAKYAEARAKFLDAAKVAGARLASYRNPARGPEGEELFTDTSWIGPPEADRVMLLISATHGVEGFCGSGVQVGWHDSGLAKELPEKTAVLTIHASNPHGFAWLRRVTEDNVDLNRNFVDHGKDYPNNPAYEVLHEAICPRGWDDADIAASATILNAYADEHGTFALQGAITAGQYKFADGLFYGGKAPTWAARTLLEILKRELAGARRVAVIDYHTGLGPRGYGERICVHAPGSPALARAESWYAGDITSPALGSSSSAELTGVNLLGIVDALPHAQVTGIALEYGTLPTEDVILALRADNWLHAHGDPASAKGQAIKAQIRDAFYQDADDWKQMIWDRGIETQNLALKGLSEG
jgi:uncharacterized protein DUF2817